MLLLSLCFFNLPILFILVPVVYLGKMIIDFNKIFRWELPEELLQVLSKFGRILFVGGFVRDQIIGFPVSDQDILVSGISLEELCEILSRYGKAEIVGRSFPIVKFHRGGKTYDFSVPTVRNHKDPHIDPNMLPEQDLFQRDFTVNAMAYDILQSRFIDPFGGIRDIGAKAIRVVSPESFNVDPLRVIRMCRLSARLGFSSVSDTAELAKVNSSLLAEVATERIGEEFKKIMLLEKPSEVIVCLHNIGALGIVLPELVSCVGITQPGGMHAYDVFEHTLFTIDNSPPDLLVRFSALFHDITKPVHRYVESDGRARFYGHPASSADIAKKWLEKYAFSHRFAEDVVTLIKNHMFTHAETEKGIRRFIRRVGKDLIDPLFQLRFADTKAQGSGGELETEIEYYARVKEIIEKKPPLSVNDLAVNGYDVMEFLKIQPGPAVGKALNALLQYVLDTPSLNTKEQLIKILDKIKVQLDEISGMDEELS